jgi:class 3 adenylate cyclase
MVGSTALSGEVDPEVLGNLIRRYQDVTAGAIGRFGGFVAKFMGDGVLAYFGFPRAFEDAAERAVRAAIAVVAEIGDIERPDGARLQARVGIATGLVVVGEIVGTGTAQERTIVGETPNLAARLQAFATPDTILISESTQNLLGGLFQLEPAGEHELKGFARPVPVWRVLGEAGVVSRFAAIRTGSTPLVGRAHEMALMFDRWRLASQGEGQIVTLIGEAGIGKSRALEALQEAIGREPHGLIYLQCSPYHTDSALYPVIQHIARTAGFATADSPGTRIEKIAALFSQRAASDPSAIALLAELLSRTGTRRIADAGATKGSDHYASCRGDRSLGRSQADAPHRRRRALDRCDGARNADAYIGQYCASAPACRRRGAAGFRTALVGAAPCDFADAEPIEPRRMHGVDLRRCRHARPGAGNHCLDRRQDRRRAAVRGGIDEKRAGIRGRGQRRGAGNAQGFADGTP